MKLTNALKTLEKLKLNIKKSEWNDSQYSVKINDYYLNFFTKQDEKISIIYISFPYGKVFFKTLKSAIESCGLTV